MITRFLIYTGYLFWLNGQMALITLTIGPMMLLLGKVFTKGIQKRTKSLCEAEASCETVVFSGLNALGFIKINQLADFMNRRYHKAWDNREKSNARSDRCSILYDELSSFLGVVGSILILGAAALLLANDYLMVGTVVAYLQLHNEIVWPFIEVSSLWRSLVGSKVSIARIEEALRLPAEKKKAANSPKTVESIGAKEVSFSYDAENPVLSGVNFTARKGEIVCLLGENGAGKSTLLKLLCGLYLPTKGEIYLDDVPLTMDNMQEIRGAYGFVMQQEHVFDGTILENLLYGEGVSQKHLENCAAKTGFDAYVRELEEGYETRLTNAGLSGGELKKLSLTRMLLADKPVLVLDEPFAHLDAEGCQLLIGLLEELRPDKIIIFVTHNQEVVQYADRVVRLADGKI